MLLLAINISQQIDKIELHRDGLPPIVIKKLSPGTYSINDKGESSSIEIPVAITITDEILPQIDNRTVPEIVVKMKEYAIALAQEWKNAKKKIIPHRIAREAASAVAPRLKGRKLKNAIDTVRHAVSDFVNGKKTNIRRQSRNSSYKAMILNR